MPTRLRQPLLLAILIAFGLAVFLPGINWGLPSRAVDPYLFGERTPWTGQEILTLAPEWRDERLGADVDLNPLPERHRPIQLNQTDAQRAEIIRRYRLFSYQPDEMITFRALARMRPSEGRLDPKLYQYGGLWIYPVGLLLKVASILDIVPLRGDLAFYLDNPAAFGRFYIIARLYTVAWGVVGIWAVFWVVRRASGSAIAAVGAAACYVCLPVVINMAHEAKPHLPGAVLMLLSIIAAAKFTERGTTCAWVLASALCGAAAAMVLSAAVIFIIIPIMALLGAGDGRRRLIIILAGTSIGAGVYLATNPYVAINFFSNRQVLHSNLANTAAMYEFGRLGDGLLNALKLMREGTSPGVSIVAVMALAALAVRAVYGRRIHPLGWLIGAPALIITLQFIFLAAGKPGEYGRFALLPDLALMIAAASAIGLLGRGRRDRIVGVALLILLAALPGWFYLRGFISDASPATARRMDDADWLRQLQQAGGRTLGVYAEPAPYALPPVDLFAWNLVLLPHGFDLERDPTDADVIIRPVDELGDNGAPAGGFVRHSIVGPSDVFPTRISWADKPFEIWLRPELIERLR